MAAAEAVCDPEGTFDLLDPVSVLVDHSLVVSRDAGDGVRFGMLESIRAYALQRLARNGAGEPVRERHGAYFLALAEQAREQLHGSGQRLWLNRLEADHDNLRAALAFYRDADGSEAMARLATALTYFWWIRGHLTEGRRWLGEVRDRLAADSPRRARVLKDLGVLAYVQGDYAAAQTAYEAARALLRGTDQPVELASVVGNLGILALERWDLDAARALLEESLELSRGLGNPGLVGPALSNLGLLLIRQGDLDGAHAHLDEAVAIHRRAHDDWRLTTSLLNLGEVLLTEGRVEAAREAFTESLRLATRLGDLDSTAFGLEATASLAAARSDGVRAARLWGAAEALRESIGTPRPPGSGAISYESDVDRMRRAVGDQAFQTHWAAGRSLPRSECLALAVGAAEPPPG